MVANNVIQSTYTACVEIIEHVLLHLMVFVVLHVCMCCTIVAVLEISTDMVNEEHLVIQVH